MSFVADGRRIPCTEVSPIDDAEMRELMQDILNRHYTFHLKANEPKFQATSVRWMGASSTWGEQETDLRIISRGGNWQSPKDAGHLAPRGIRARCSRF